MQFVPFSFFFLSFVPFSLSFLFLFFLFPLPFLSFSVVVSALSAWSGRKKKGKNKHSQPRRIGGCSVLHHIMSATKGGSRHDPVYRFSFSASGRVIERVFNQFSCSIRAGLGLSPPERRVGIEPLPLNPISHLPARPPAPLPRRHHHQLTLPAPKALCAILCPR